MLHVVGVLPPELAGIDLEELAAFRAQTRVRNPEGSYVLYKTGDVWAGRNVHAAMFDAARICQRL